MGNKQTVVDWLFFFFVLGLWILFLSLFLSAFESCSQGAVLTSGGQGAGGTVVIYVPMNDCVSSSGVYQGKECTVYSEYWWTPSHGVGNNPPQVQGPGFASQLILPNVTHLNIQTDQGTVYGLECADVGTSITNIQSVQLNVNIVPSAGSGAVAQSYTETWINASDGLPSCGLLGLYTLGGIAQISPDPYYSTPNPQCQNQQPGCYPTVGYNNLPSGYTNNSATPQNVTWSGPDGQTQNAVLQPGQSTNFTISWPAGNGSTGTLSVQNQGANDGNYNDYGYGNGYQSTNAQIYYNNGSFLTNYTTGGFTNFYIPPGASENALSSGQGGIMWNGTNTTPAENQTLQAGFQLLNNDELANQNAANLNSSNLLAQLTNRTSPISVQIAGTNTVSGGGTNVFNGASNVWVQNWPSNLLNPQSNSSVFGSNVWVQNFPSNWPAETSSLLQAQSQVGVPSWSTNLSTLTNTVAGFEGNYGLSSWLATLSPQLPVDSDPGSTLFQIGNFCGYTLNFDPQVEFPSVISASKTGWTIVLVLLFCYWLSSKFWELVRGLSTMRGSNVPDADVEVAGFTFSLGGNFLGWSVFYLVITGVLVGLWTLSLVWFFSNATVVVASYMTQSMNIVSWTNSLGTDAWHLFIISFPVPLAFSLFVSRIVLQFTMSGVFQFAALCMRFLPTG